MMQRIHARHMEMIERYEDEFGLLDGEFEAGVEPIFNPRRRPKHNGGRAPSSQNTVPSHRFGDVQAALGHLIAQRFEPTEECVERSNDQQLEALQAYAEQHGDIELTAEVNGSYPGKDEFSHPIYRLLESAD